CGCRDDAQSRGLRRRVRQGLRVRHEGDVADPGRGVGGELNLTSISRNYEAERVSARPFFRMRPVGTPYLSSSNLGNLAALRSNVTIFSPPCAATNRPMSASLKSASESRQSPSAFQTSSAASTTSCRDVSKPSM